MDLPLRQLITESLTLPRHAARRVLSIEVGYQWALGAGLVTIIAGTLLSMLMQAVFPTPANPLAAMLVNQPALVTAVQFSFLVVMAGLVTIIGRWFGGTGNHTDALKLMVLIQAVMVLIQVVQFVLLLALPVLAAMVSLAAVFWFFWALSAFVTELHGFDNVLKVFGGIFISVIGVLFGLSLLIMLLGIPVPMPEMG